MKSTGLPNKYGIVLDFEKARDTKSDHQKFEGLYDNPLVIARAGGIEAAKLYLDRAKEKHGTEKYGQWHRLNEVDSNQAQGRLLFLGDNDYSGLVDGSSLDSNGRFVGVAPEAHVNEKNGTPLEARVKSALDAGQAFEHNGTLYVPVNDKRVALSK